MQIVMRQNFQDGSRPAVRSAQLMDGWRHSGRVGDCWGLPACDERWRLSETSDHAVELTGNPLVLSAIHIPAKRPALVFWLARW